MSHTRLWAQVTLCPRRRSGAAQNNHRAWQMAPTFTPGVRNTRRISSPTLRGGGIPRCASGGRRACARRQLYPWSPLDHGQPCPSSWLDRSTAPGALPKLNRRCYLAEEWAPSTNQLGNRSRWPPEDHCSAPGERGRRQLKFIDDGSLTLSVQRAAPSKGRKGTAWRTLRREACGRRRLTALGGRRRAGETRRGTITGVRTWLRQPVEKKGSVLACSRPGA
jgi:hypothetical protein